MKLSPVFLVGLLERNVSRIAKRADAGLRGRETPMRGEGLAVSPSRTQYVVVTSFLTLKWILVHWPSLLGLGRAVNNGAASEDVHPRTSDSRGPGQGEIATIHC